MLTKNKLLFGPTVLILFCVNVIYAGVYVGQEICIHNSTKYNLEATYYYHGHTQVAKTTTIPARKNECITIPPPKYTPFTGACIGHKYFAKLSVHIIDAAAEDEGAIYHLEYAPSPHRPSLCLWTISTQTTSKRFDQTINNIRDPILEASVIQIYNSAIKTQPLNN